MSEYQCFNLEFCKNELNLNNQQTANVLNMFWLLLEFDPDEKTIEKDFNDDSQLQNQKTTNDNDENIAYLGDLVNLDEEEHKKLLKNKFELFRKLL